MLLSLALLTPIVCVREGVNDDHDEKSMLILSLPTREGVCVCVNSIITHLIMMLILRLGFIGSIIQQTFWNAAIRREQPCTHGWRLSATPNHHPYREIYALSRDTDEQGDRSKASEKDVAPCAYRCERL